MTQLTLFRIGFLLAVSGASFGLHAQERNSGSADWVLATLKQSAAQIGPTPQSAVDGFLSRYFLLKMDDEEHAGIASALEAALDINRRIPEADERARNLAKLELLVRLDPSRARLIAKYRDPTILQEYRKRRDSAPVREFSPDWTLQLLESYVLAIQVGSPSARLMRLCADYLRYRKAVDSRSGGGSDIEHAHLIHVLERVLLGAYVHLIDDARGLDKASGWLVEVFPRLTSFTKDVVLDSTIMMGDTLGMLEAGKPYYQLAREFASTAGSSGSGANYPRLSYFQVRLRLGEAWAHLHLGQYRPAEEILKEAESRLAGIQLMKDRREMRGYLSRYRAQIRMRGRDYAAAIREYNAAAKEFTLIEHPEIINTLGELAQAQIYMNSFEGATASIHSGFTRVLAFRSRRKGTWNYARERALHVARVLLLLETKQYTAMSEAIAEGRKLVGSDPTAAFLFDLWEASYEMEAGGGCPAALPKLESALSHVGPWFESPEVEKAAFQAGACREESGALEHALPYLERAMTVDRNLRKAARVSSNYFARLNDPQFDRVQRRLIKVLYDLWKRDGVREAESQRKLLFYAGAIKSRWLEDEIESMRGGVTFESPFRSPDAPLPEKVSRDRPAVTAERPLTEADMARRRLQGLIAALESGHGAEVVLLDYVPVELRDRLLLFVADRRKVELLELPSSWQKTTATVQELRSLLQRSLQSYLLLRSSKRRDLMLEGDLSKVEADVLKRLATLGSSLLPESVAARIQDKSVVIAPFGQLHNVPFPALRVKGANGLSYLIDHVARLANTPSANILDLIVERYLRSMPGQVSSVLLAGNVKEPGVAAAEEFVAIRTAFSGAGETSARKDLKELMRSRSALHFAAHASFDPRDTARSGIRLDDGILELGDIAMLELDKVRVVSMGSCETGRADVSRPGDEVWSLASAFMFAGVPAVVGYLWRLDSESSRDFYGHFYRSLADGQEVGRAFRAAMLAVRGRPRNAEPPLLGNTSPCYWAGFHLIGE